MLLLDHYSWWSQEAANKLIQYFAQVLAAIV